MNEINVKRMLLAGLAMLVMWVAVGILVNILFEQVIAPVFFGQTAQEMWLEIIEPGDRSALNFWVESFISLLNCTLLIWLYASLRPMYGVGTKTALVASAFGVILGFSLFINLINLGLIPLKLGLIEAVSEAIVFPIAMLAGAAIYEGQEKWDRPAE
jgi:hypothetical protein